MRKMDSSRRRFLQLAGVTVIGVSAGCLGDDDDAQDYTEYVPQNTELVAHGSMRVTEDPDSESLLAVLFGEDVFIGGEADDVESGLDEFESETGLDPREVTDVTFFTHEGSGPGSAEGVHVFADWDVDDVIAAVEMDMNATYTEEEWDGITVYVPEDGTGDPFAVPEDGVFLLGSELAVELAVAVAAGEADGLDGPVQEAFEYASGGYATGAMVVRDEQVPQSPAFEEGGVDTGALTDIEAASATYDTDDGSVIAQVYLHASSDSAAEDIQDATEGLISLYRGEFPEEDIQEQLGHLEVSRDDNIVIIDYSETVESIIDFIESMTPDGGQPNTMNPIASLA